MPCKLGRIENFDPRSRKYSIRNKVGDPPPRSFDWYVTTQLNQGNVSACTGFSWSHFLAATPNPSKGVTDQSALQLYREAQKRDEWVGETYEGSSVLGAVKALKEIYPDALSSYSWAFGLDDMVIALGYVGPVVLGVPWYSEMFSPGLDGIIRVGGQDVGGHAILCTGVDIYAKRFRLKNSWGIDWGISGDCFISFEDMEILLKRNGECCVGHGKQSVNIA